MATIGRRELFGGGLGVLGALGLAAVTANYFELFPFGNSDPDKQKEELLKKLKVDPDKFGADVLAIINSRKQSGVLSSSYGDIVHDEARRRLGNPPLGLPKLVKPDNVTAEAFEQDVVNIVKERNARIKPEEAAYFDLVNDEARRRLLAETASRKAPEAPKPVTAIKPVEAAKPEAPKPMVTMATTPQAATRTVDLASTQATGTPIPSTPGAELSALRAELAAVNTKVAELKGHLTPFPEVVMKSLVAGIKVSATFPDRPNNTVDIAKGVFKNTIGLGTEAFTAEPGALLVNSDFESKATDRNPNGANPAGWGAMYDSRGHIRQISPDTQHSFTYAPPAEYLLAQGGWDIFAAPRLRFTIQGVEKDRVVDLPAAPNVGYLVWIRGPYADHPQAKNVKVVLLDFEVAATLGMRAPAGNANENQAFWSEGQVKQMVRDMHTGESNCGMKGCSEVRVVYLDYNTGAFGIWRNDATGNWSLMHKNY